MSDFELLIALQNELRATLKQRANRTIRLSQIS